MTFGSTNNPLRPYGGVFERTGAKNSPQQSSRQPRPTQPASAAAPQVGAPYTKLEDTARQQLLQSMLMRARGGQAGGAPTAPLPAPNSNIPS